MKNINLITAPLRKANPITVLILGICSALAVTAKLKPAIVMGRLEAFAMAHNPWESLLDGIGNGLGYGSILVIVAFFRELFGSGTLLGYQVIPQGLYDFGYVNNGLMILPPMALIIIGIIIWLQKPEEEK